MLLSFKYHQQNTHMLQEDMQLWVATWLDGDFKQRHEDVLQHLLEITELFLSVIDITAEETLSY